MRLLSDTWIGCFPRVAWAEPTWSRWRSAAFAFPLGATMRLPNRPFGERGASGVEAISVRLKRLTLRSFDERS